MTEQTDAIETTDAPSTTTSPELSRRGYLASVATSTAGVAASTVGGVAAGASTATAQSQASVDVEPSEKRGYVGSDPARANAMGAGWFYNYMPTEAEVDAFDHATFLPMINGDDLGWTSGASDRILNSDYEETHVLGYNEPEHEEGYTDVETILSHWETLSSKFRDTDVAICSPSIKTATSTGREYLDAFMSAVESDDALVVDELAIHWYAGTEAMRDDPETQAQWFLDELDSLHEAYGRPIWITEFGGPNFANIDADALAASNIAFLHQVIPELESRDYVRGYAWWEGGRATTLTEVTDGVVQLTDVGRAYVGRTSGSEPSRLTDLPTSEAVSSGTYQLESVASGHVLEVADGSETDGADVQQGAENDAASQQWGLQYDGDGRYQLVAAHSGKAADVTDASDENGANVQQWAANDGDHQRWHLDSLEGDEYRVVAAHSGLVLDVLEGSTAEGTSVVQYEWNGGNNQRWRLVPVDSGPCTDAASGSADSAGGSAEIDGQTVCDVNGDGLYRDLDGNGEVTHADVQSFFSVQHRPTWKQPSTFDFNGNDVVGHGDVVALFEHVATGQL